MPCSVDNLSEYNQKRAQLYTTIKEYNSAGYSKRQISTVLHCSRNTVTKYLNGEYEALCKKDFRSGMDPFYDYIIRAVTSGMSRKDVYRNVIEKGYKGGKNSQWTEDICIECIPGIFAGLFWREAMKISVRHKKNWRNSVECKENRMKIY